MTDGQSEACREAMPLSVPDARAKRVCRFCGGQGIPRQNPDGTIDPFVYNFGKEYAHESCIEAHPSGEKAEGGASVKTEEDIVAEFNLLSEQRQQVNGRAQEFVTQRLQALLWVLGRSEREHLLLDKAFLDLAEACW